MIPFEETASKLDQITFLEEKFKASTNKRDTHTNSNLIFKKSASTPDITATRFIRVMAKTGNTIKNNTDSCQNLINGVTFTKFFSQ